MRTPLEEQLIWAYEIAECHVVLERIPLDQLKEIGRGKAKSEFKNESIQQIFEEHNYFKQL